MKKQIKSDPEEKSQTTNKNPQNKLVNKNFILKQFGFFILAVLWGLAIVFKSRMSTLIRIVVFIVLVILTIFGIYELNKKIFGGKNNDL